MYYVFKNSQKVKATTTQKQWLMSFDEVNTVFYIQNIDIYYNTFLMTYCKNNKKQHNSWKHHGIQCIYGAAISCIHPMTNTYKLHRLYRRWQKNKYI